MINIIEKVNCCGCSACVQACPKQCICFDEDEQGFRYPLVNKDLCVDCGLCENVCPCLNQNEKKEPLKVVAAKNPNEDVRLKYRYLDLRNPEVNKNIKLRSELLHFLRNKMYDLGFTEVQTPILTASSPEGARDFVVPSRNFKGKFYALPQAPQIYKELLMVGGFEKYFQIAQQVLIVT